MSRTIALALAALIGAGVGCARADAAAGQARAATSLRIVALGDSLTAGYGIGRDQAYPAVLDALLREAGLPFVVINQGLSGDTTAGGVRRLRRALAERPHILILALGANDGLRGVPVATVRRNLEQIIEQAQAAGVAVLLCGMHALPRYGRQYTLEFGSVYPELARKYGVGLVPFLLTGVVGNPSMLLRDRVHPNEAGARLIAANVWTYLRPMAAALGETS